MASGLVVAPLDQELTSLEGPLRGDEQLLEVDRLDEEVGGPVLEGLHRGLDLPHAGEDEDGGVGVDGPRPLEEGHAVHHRHVDVRHGEGRPLRLEDGEALAPVLRGTALPAAGEEELLEDAARLPIVLDDEHAMLVGVAAEPGHGTRTSRESVRASPTSS